MRRFTQYTTTKTHLLHQRLAAHRLVRLDRGLDVFTTNVESCPIEMRWLVFRGGGEQSQKPPKTGRIWGWCVLGDHGKRDRRNCSEKPGLLVTVLYVRVSGGFR